MCSKIIQSIAIWKLNQIFIKHIKYVSFVFSLNFERHNDEPKGNRIVFTDVDGCASNVGKHPLGEPQFVSLAPECIRVSVFLLPEL